MNIGEATRLRILELCKLNNITPNKLSTISGITQSTINNIISGRNNSATVSTVKKICDGLEITIVQFFESDLFQNLEQEIKWFLGGDYSVMLAVFTLFVLNYGLKTIILGIYSIKRSIITLRWLTTKMC